MKIAKKFMALALAAVLSVGCAFGVSADGSRTKDVTVEISVPSITDTMENIQLVCYNEETKEWTIVDPINVDKEKKTIKVALDDLCYFTIVADAKEDTAE